MEMIHHHPMGPMAWERLHFLNEFLRWMWWIWTSDTFAVLW